MNYKQKLGYTLLGAAVMAVGIIIGQLSTPNIEAQSNGVFDEIVCKKITVVDADGTPGILLESSKEDGNRIIINHLSGERAVGLGAGKDVVFLSLNKPSGQEAATLIAAEPATFFNLYGDAEKGAIKLGVLGDSTRSIMINDEKGTARISLITSTLGFGTHAVIHDATGQKVWSAP